MFVRFWLGPVLVLWRVVGFLHLVHTLFLACTLCCVLSTFHYTIYLPRFLYDSSKLRFISGGLPFARFTILFSWQTGSSCFDRNNFSSRAKECSRAVAHRLWHSAMRAHRRARGSRHRTCRRPRFNHEPQNQQCMLLLRVASRMSSSPRGRWASVQTDRRRQRSSAHAGGSMILTILLRAGPCTRLIDCGPTLRPPGHLPA